MRGITDTLLMVRPKDFGSNKDTIVDNKFQAKMEDEAASQISKDALTEFDEMVKELKRHDINVIVVEDQKEPFTPDAIFPNNWISSHKNGSIITYPMKAPSRQLERREDVVDMLTEKYGYKKRYGFEYHEKDELYLEGTGSMVLDRHNKKVYACLSARTDIKVLEKFAVLMDYNKIIFHATDRNDNPIYHTNVMMAMGTDYVIICLDSIKSIAEKKAVKNALEDDGKKIIEITIDQMEQFAGNMLQVMSKLGNPYLIMSQSAYYSLTSKQIDEINKFNKIINIPIPTIEQYGGGSVRCMIMEVFKAAF